LCKVEIVLAVYNVERTLNRFHTEHRSFPYLTKAAWLYIWCPPLILRAYYLSRPMKLTSHEKTQYYQFVHESFRDVDRAQVKVSDLWKTGRETFFTWFFNL